MNVGLYRIARKQEIQRFATIALALVTVCMVGHVGCGRNGAGIQASLTIVGITSPDTIEAGQPNVPIVITLRNHGATPLEIVSTLIEFHQNEYDVSLQYTLADPPQAVLPPNAELTIKLNAQASNSASPGPVTGELIVWVRSPQGALLTARSKRTNFWTVRGEQVVIARVTTDSPWIRAGQASVAVTVEIDNFAPHSLQDVAVELNYELAGRSVDHEYISTPAASNPVTLEPQSTEVWKFNVTVRPDISGGNVIIDASAEGLLGNHQTFRITGARETARWSAVDGSLLVVTVAEDEDDTGSEPTLAAAGGPNDLSLREAILILNQEDGTTAGQHAITFSPSVFTPHAPVTIHTKSVLGPFPAVTVANTVIDGAGTAMVVDGSATAGNGFVAASFNFALRNMSIGGFTGAGAACLSAVDVAGVTLDNMHFHHCGGTGRAAGVVIKHGYGHRISRSTFASSAASGLTIAGTASKAVVEDSWFEGNGVNGLSLSGDDHVLRSNHFVRNSGAGLHVNGASNVNVKNCEASQNGSHGIMTDSSSSACVFEDNSYDDNAASGIAALDNSFSIQIKGGTFSRNAGAPISIEADTNDGVLAPIHGSIISGGVAGTIGSQGTLQAFARNMQGDLACVGGMDVGPGDWTFPLPLSTQGARFTFTTVSGSTSEMSRAAVTDLSALVVTTPNDELDGGPTLDNLAAAGGVDDLSLREAIVLANNSQGPKVVTFSTAVFPVDIETVISVDFEPRLPPMRHAGSSIDGGASHVVIDGGETLDLEGQGLIHMAAADGSVRNVTLRGYSSSSGALVMVTADRVTVHDVRLLCGSTVTGVRILNGADKALIENSYVENCDLGVYVYQSHEFVVRNNRIASPLEAGIYSRSANSFVIEGNRIHHSAGMGIGCVYGNASTMVGNQIWGGTGSGVSLHICRAITVRHNTLVNNYAGVTTNYTNGQVTIVNNIIAESSRGGIGLGDQGGASEANNLFHNNGSGPSEDRYGSYDGPIDPSSISGNPEFIDTDAGLFTPQALAIDTAVDLGIDRNGTLPGLFNGAGPDIGAIESVVP